MKFYGEYRFASVSMSNDKQFKDGLQHVFRQFKIGHILESGTYTGTGSTKTLAEALLATGSVSSLHSFYTLEVDYRLHKEARKNLQPYPFVMPVWGMSVTKQEALAFVKEDEALKNHRQIDNVFIDNVDDPVTFYTNEINGRLFGANRANRSNGKFTSLLKLFASFKEGMFAERIPLIKNEFPLFLLDSAGGIGWLEFQRVLQLMEGREHIIVLDDTHHLKHFRSLKHIKNDNRFSVLAENEQHGWVIAHYKQTAL